MSTKDHLALKKHAYGNFKNLIILATLCDSHWPPPQYRARDEFGRSTKWRNSYICSYNLLSRKSSLFFFCCCFFPLSDLPSRAKHFVLSMQFDHYHLMNNNCSVIYFVYFWFSACCVAACMRLCFVQTVLKLGWVLITYLGILKCIENYHASFFRVWTRT